MRGSGLQISCHPEIPGTPNDTKHFKITPDPTYLGCPQVRRHQLVNEKSDGVAGPHGGLVYAVSDTQGDYLAGAVLAPELDTAQGMVALTDRRPNEHRRFGIVGDLRRALRLSLAMTRALPNSSPRTAANACSSVDAPARWLEVMSIEAMSSGSDSAVLIMPAFSRSANGALKLAK